MAPRDISLYPPFLAPKKPQGATWSFDHMMLKRPTLYAIRIAAFVALTIGATSEVFAQQPSQAQVNAIRQACRSDYMAHCSSVPTGGAAALQCLQQHASSMSGGCQQAL